MLGVQYYNDGMAEAQVVHATWNETSYSFSTALPEFTGRWIYRAAYPAPETDGSVEFGSSRTQKGNAYNSKYDLMRGTVMTTEAPAGKTDDGKDIIFDMTRETAIAYFHFTSKLAEKVVSAKLSVTGGSIANSSVIIDDNNSFVFSDDKPLNEITITFEEGTAPDATDFKLWYNVRPTSYSSMTLEVETTDHKMTISRNSNGAYESGRLYKVVKDIADDKWIAKGGETPKPTVIEDVLTADKFKATGTTYTAFTGVKATSSAVYAGNTANNNGAIQMRSRNSDCGIVTTTSGGSATRVSVVWGGTSDKDCTIDIYGKSTAYSKASDLYATQDGDQGTKIGSIICGTSTELVIEGDYPYIGIRSKSGALYLDSITITWEDAKTALETPAHLQVSAEKVVSWDAVSGAASYEVTIGKDTFISETNSYNATDITDDYYDVCVVAVPSDKDNYKNSAAATLTNAKFGAPTLATPTLKKGAIDGASISVSWSVDERATAGYNCELFKGDVKIGESKTVNAGAVTFTGLDAETAYVVKVNAIAVEGAKAYAASPVATLTLSTKVAGNYASLTKADIVGLGTLAYTTEKTITKENLTWYFKAYKDKKDRPWVQLNNTGAYIKVIAPKPIKEIRLTITAASNQSGGIEDITKHTDYSKDIHLKTTDSIGTSDTDDVAKTSVITNHLATLVPTGSNTELYIKVSAGARIWGIEVDY